MDSRFPDGAVKTFVLSPLTVWCAFRGIATACLFKDLPRYGTAEHLHKSTSGQHMCMARQQGGHAILNGASSSRSVTIQTHSKRFKRPLRGISRPMFPIPDERPIIVFGVHVLICMLPIPACAAREYSPKYIPGQ